MDTQIKKEAGRDKKSVRKLKTVAELKILPISNHKKKNGETKLVVEMTN